MTKLVKLTIDDIEYDVPEGMNLVDAAKQYAGVDIPVFCYHPKLGHDGNCRMCLVELGTPRPNRETGEFSYGRVPPYSVVVPGSLPSKDGSYNLNCAIIVKQVDEKTRSKVGINELLREA